MYVFMMFTDTYLSNEIDAALEWTPLSINAAPKLVFDINKRRDVQSIDYGTCFCFQLYNTCILHMQMKVMSALSEKQWR